LLREEFRLFKLILHSELRRRAASRRALPCPSSIVNVLCVQPMSSKAKPVVAFIKDLIDEENCSPNSCDSNSDSGRGPSSDDGNQPHHLHNNNHQPQQIQQQQQLSHLSDAQSTISCRIVSRSLSPCSEDLRSCEYTSVFL